MPSFVEEEIVEQYNKGDVKAFTSIYNKLYAPVFYFACSFTDNDKAADLTTIAFASLWRKKPLCTSIKSIKGYLQVTVKNNYFNYANKQRKDIIETVDFQTFFEEEQFLIQPQIETQILFETKGLLLQKIEEAIEQLPIKCREIIKLAFYDGIKNEVISSQLNISIHTVRTQKQRGISLLRKKLKYDFFK